MRLPEHRFLIVFAVTLATCVPLVESVDPRFPEELAELKGDNPASKTRWLPAKIRHLEEEQRNLISLISQLPQHAPQPLSGALGFHSLQHTSEGESGDGPHYLTADLVWNQFLHSIGMVPALDPMDPLRNTYAFPKRFSIQVLEGTSVFQDGEWVQGPDAEVWVDVVNWMDEDFPDPGPYPVVFSDINLMASKIRLVVAEGYTHDDAEFFSLGELYLFRGLDGAIADNMSDFGHTGIAFEASDSMSLKPTWDLEYIYDGVSILGLPLSETKADAQDFVVTFERDRPASETVQILMDLGKVERIGRIELWPTEAPSDMAVPLFGFPESVVVEISRNPDFNGARTIEVHDARERMQEDNRLTVICDGDNAQFIRLSFDNLFKFMDHPMLAPGEVSVLEFGKVFSIGCDVTAQGVPETSLKQLSRLVDGFSRQRKILPESDWIIGLAKRRPLDIRLRLVESELTEAREQWADVLTRLGVLGGILLLFVMVVGVAFLKRQRLNELKRLKLQITRDLHDEVGSNLGSISLASEQLENLDLDAGLKEELNELSLMAREANASLVEVVWMTDQTSVYLSDLVGRLIQRAQKVLRKQEVIADVSRDVPELKVNLTAKRHVISFFKEAVHNCARHSGASRVLITVAINNQQFRLSIQDNGRGFDPGIVQDGWGIGSMKKRAVELGGELELDSRPGEGTRILLQVPLASLVMNPSQPYKTSN